MSHPPKLTHEQQLVAGPALRQGHLRGYHSLQPASGLAHTVRDELAGPSVAAAVAAAGAAGGSAGAAGGAGSAGKGRSRRPLLALAHLTDVQLADVQSPSRFEFFHHAMDDPRFAKLVPVHRPQEALTAHATNSMISTLNRLHESQGTPLTGRGLDLAVTTGDAIDNAQWNELCAFLALMDGGLVRLKQPGTPYRGVQSLSWPDNIFWRPDGDGLTGPDLFRAAYAYGHRPGLIEQALADFEAGGLRMPWLACYGNHEALTQGVGVITPQLAAAMVGDRKPARLPAGADLNTALDLFTDTPHLFLDAPDTDLQYLDPDPDRRPISRREFVSAHRRAGARPSGHGYTLRNETDGTAYYRHDQSGVAMICLDTTCLAGSADGCLDAEQASWLRNQLIEVHSQYTNDAGNLVSTGNPDQLVVIFSHHGLATLTSTRGPVTADGSPALGGPGLLRLLHQFPNVVLWLNGHTHTNDIQPRQHPSIPGQGFWEVTTCAIVDWPCQARIVELIDEGEGVLSIACTMIDHDGDLVPGEGQLSSAGLAGLHREIAGNVPWAGFDSGTAGTPADRNVILPLRAPFALR